MKSELRKCEVDNKKGWFHKWTDIADVIPPSIQVGGTPGGQFCGTFAIVEYEDGSVEQVRPYKIKFTSPPHMRFEYDEESW